MLDEGFKESIARRVDLIPSNTMLLGLRAADDWSLDNGIQQAGAFVEANVNINDEIKLFAEASANTEAWQAMTGIKIDF